MNDRLHGSNTTYQKQQLQTNLAPRMLGDLYWYVQVIEAGSFSGAADRTGVAKSSLSRRIAQLERALNVQLLNRNTRLFAMTTIGERIYRHALDMISSMEAALLCALETNSTASGLIRLAAPSSLSDWTLNTMASFQNSHPRVQFALTLEDGALDLAAQRLDLALSLDEVPSDSSTLVARPLAELAMVIVGTPTLLTRLGHPKHLNQVDDQYLLTLGTHTLPQPWKLQTGLRDIHQPALQADNTHTLLKAARTGLGLACVPLYACREDFVEQRLQRACLGEQPCPTVLHALTPPHKGITSTARQLIEHMRQRLISKEREGISLLFEAIPGDRDR
ncbi:LysR substrate-binding domain-containing protein [Pseudomonas mendocina]|uniref:LysR family transcriptional regulator n=1 Tax=Ectopseudomonas mendocina TaxID=300 RepID=UPI0023D99A9B|nr:LysR substrate-binding domain-containing protein [Pseudomonas mendocina]MDF2076066.1 LysR substrate-binding domain-containing protein [Pseudomonas mendocina]